LRDIKDLPETIEPFEDPNEFPETEIEETSDTIYPSKKTTPEELGPRPEKLPDSEDLMEQRERRANTQHEQNNQQSLTEQRERKVGQQKTSMAEDKGTQQRRIQQKRLKTEEHAGEQIKRAIERIGKILN
jgi:hypothetical protein